MTEIDKILITSVATVFGGLLIFTFGQLILKFIIEPIHALKKTLSEIQYALIFHAPAIQTPVGDLESEKAAQSAIRKLSCDLRINIEAIPLYRFWVIVFWNQPSKKNGLSAATHLIGLSNSVFEKDRTRNYDIVRKVCRLLKIEAPE